MRSSIMTTQSQFSTLKESRWTKDLISRMMKSTVMHKTMNQALLSPRSRMLLVAHGIQGAEESEAQPRTGPERMTCSRR